MSFSFKQSDDPMKVAAAIQAREDLQAIQKEPLLAMLDHLVDQNVDYVAVAASGHHDQNAVNMSITMQWNTGSPE